MEASARWPLYIREGGAGGGGVPRRRAQRPAPVPSACSGGAAAHAVPAPTSPGHKRGECGGTGGNTYGTVDRVRGWAEGPGVGGAAVGLDSLTGGRRGEGTGSRCGWRRHLNTQEVCIYCTIIKFIRIVSDLYLLGLCSAPLRVITNVPFFVSMERVWA